MRQCCIYAGTCCAIEPWHQCVAHCVLGWCDIKILKSHDPNSGKNARYYHTYTDEDAMRWAKGHFTYFRALFGAVPSRS